VVDLSMSRNRGSFATRTNPSGVIAALIQLPATVSAQVLLELSALHAVIR